MLEQYSSVFIKYYIQKDQFNAFRAAQELTEAGVSHVLATVDATQERDLASRFEIKVTNT